MNTDLDRVKYLESLLPLSEDVLSERYWSNFEKYASYLGNGVYSWTGILANDTRELWLMGVLWKEGIEFEQN